MGSIHFHSCFLPKYYSFWNTYLSRQLPLKLELSTELRKEGFTLSAGGGGSRDLDL